MQAWLWTGIAIATVFFIGRLCARILGPGRLYVDDVFILITWVLVVATGALWQRVAADMFYALDVSSGLAVAGPELLDRINHWVKVVFVTDIFYYTALVTFKLSMLFFFRRLGHSVDRFRRAWWPALMVSLVTYIVAIGHTSYRCTLGDIQTIMSECATEEAMAYKLTQVESVCALDVISDFMSTSQSFLVALV